METYTRNIEELMHLGKKVDLKTHLVKNFRENVHYIVHKNNHKGLKHGGHNKIDYCLTDEAFELLQNSYNLRNRYIVDVSDSVKQVKICMCIENQTIGFIANAFKDVVDVRRQYVIGKYKADLYFIDYQLVIECDEFNHKDRDPVKEFCREEYISSFGNAIIRYNPNEIGFDLSNVLREINAHLYKSRL